MRVLSTWGLIFFLCALTGCIHYVPPVSQGQTWTKSQEEEIKIGMSSDQVKYILGSPVLISSPLRYDYVDYQTDEHGRAKPIKKLIIFFDDQHRVSRILRQ